MSLLEVSGVTHSFGGNRALDAVSFKMSVDALAIVGPKGAGKTTECGVCHGADLRGLGPVPGIAGRSPSYLVRQMYDMQQATRKGQWSELMKPVVSKLTHEDMIAIAAYAASRMP